MSDMLLWAGVAALAGVGAVARFLVSAAVARRAARRRMDSPFSSIR